MTGLRKLISDFYGNDCKGFFPSAVDGTLLVEVREMGQPRTFIALDLGKRIMAHKKRVLKGQSF